MRHEHLEDVEVRRHDELVLVRKEKRVKRVDELRNVRHSDFVGVAVECVQGESGEHSIAHRRLLAKQVRRVHLRSLLVPRAPLIDD